MQGFVKETQGDGTFTLDDGTGGIQASHLWQSDRAQQWCPRLQQPHSHAVYVLIRIKACSTLPMAHE